MALVREYDSVTRTWIEREQTAQEQTQATADAATSETIRIAKEVRDADINAASQFLAGVDFATIKANLDAAQTAINGLPAGANKQLWQAQLNFDFIVMRALFRILKHSNLTSAADPG